MLQKRNVGLGLLALIFYSVVTFFYIYQVNFTFLGMPAALHSRRIAAIILITCGIVASSKTNKQKHPSGAFKKNLKKYIYLCVFLTIFSFLQLRVIGKVEGVHLFDAMLNIALFGLPVYWALIKIYSCLDDLMHVLIIVTAIQTVIIILCLSNDSFAALMDLTFNFSEKDEGNSFLRSSYAGGIGCIAAPGAILYSLGLFASSYLYVIKRKLYYLLIFTVFAIVSTMIARTGLLFDIICILYILKEGKSLKKAVSFAIPGVVVLLIGFSIISTNSKEGFLDDRYKRYISLKEEGLRESFFEGYFKDDETYYPSLSLETLFGTGMLYGKSGRGDIVHVDGGPLRIYSAVGILLAIIVYIVIINILLNTSKVVHYNTRSYFLYAFSIILLVADFKEPTFFTVWPMPIFFTIAFLGLYGDNKWFSPSYSISSINQELYNKC